MRGAARRNALRSTGRNLSFWFQDIQLLIDLRNLLLLLIKDISNDSFSGLDITLD